MKEQLEQDLKNIEVIFSVARKELALDEQQIIELILLKRRVIEKMTQKNFSEVTE